MNCHKKVLNALTAVFIACASMFSGCAVDLDESSEDASKRILDAWLRVNGYGDVQPTTVGIYNLKDTPGTGDMLTDSLYVFVNFVSTTLDGTYVDYTSEELEKRMGGWSRTALYGPEVWYMPYQGLGLRDMLIGQGTGTDRTGGMCIGGSRTSVIVPWVKYPSTGKTVSYSDYSPYIYEVEVVGVTDDIAEYEVGQVEKFLVDRKWKETDSLYYGLYVEQTLTDPEKDTIEEGGSISLWYIGKYLNGKLFDTNIKDTAKFYGIYDEDGSYTESSISFYADSSSMMENSSYVSGFSLAVSKMKRYGDRCRTVFISDWGYGSSGDGDIPGYTPLVFDIWIEDE